MGVLSVVLKFMMTLLIFNYQIQHFQILEPLRTLKLTNCFSFFRGPG